MVAGEAAAEHSKMRERQRLEYERAKNKIKQKNATGVVNMNEKFNAGRYMHSVLFIIQSMCWYRSSDALDDSFRAATVGLVTADDFRKARETIEEMKQKQQKSEEDSSMEQKKKNEKEKIVASKRKRITNVLSFGEEEEEDAEEALTIAKKRVGGIKNPDADTSFLADRGRVAQEEEEARQRAIAEAQRVEEEKKERFTVQYSYFDGKRHRRAMEIVKGMKIGRFAELAKLQLIDDFPELRAVSSDALLYVKDDLIIPHVVP